ncbi:MAG: cation:proton antiporter [Nitrospirae bacterium]|nr:cation:proton antiporter [Magnetococcales bacterium]HAT50498.1 potassium transporter KefB [Alphaproteobacteria bacterium]
MHNLVLTELLVIFSLSVAVVMLCHRFRVAPIIGFLITGVVAGPHGLSLVSSIKEVDLLAEIGVMLLLFTIGLELSLSKLMEMKHAVFIGGGLQFTMTTMIAGGIAWNLAIPSNQAIFIGFLVTLSSTAIVLKVLQQRGETGATHGRASMGILIFQDLIVVPMLLLMPLLAGTAAHPLQELGLFLFKSTIIGLVLWFVARRFIATMLFRIVRQRDSELFLLSVIVIGLGIAWLTALAGLSLALGAFLAGLIISESEFSHQAFSAILPFRDIFTSLFFVSVGMLLDASFLWDNLTEIIIVAIVVIVIKTFLTFGSAIFTRAGFAASFAVGLCLAQVGEFSFVLAKAGIAEGLLSPTSYQFFLAVSILTMAMTPSLVERSGRWGRTLAQLRIFRRLAIGRSPVDPTRKRLTNHLVIVGLGENGQNAKQLAHRHNIPYVILETNPETVRRELASGAHIQFGDATQPAVLQHAGIMNAKTMLITIPDAAATRNIVATVRHMNTDLLIVARSNFVTEVTELESLGANHVVSLQLEASVALCHKVFGAFNLPPSTLAQDMDDVRFNRILHHTL